MSNKVYVGWFIIINVTYLLYTCFFCVLGQETILGYAMRNLNDFSYQFFKKVRSDVSLTKQKNRSVLVIMVESLNILFYREQEYNTDTTVRFVVSLLPGKLAEVEAEGIHKVFKLQTTISMTCMNAFDHNSCLTK